MKFSAPLLLLFGVVSNFSLFAIAQDTAPNTTLVEVAGTGVKILVPDGFEKATTFHGFQQETTGSSVLVTVIPGPYAAVTKGFTKEGLAAQGMKLLSKDEVTIADEDALLLNVSQDAHGQSFEKWIAVLGDDSKTTMVAGTFLASNDDLNQSLRKTVMSTTPIDSKSDSPKASPRLPFQLDDIEGLILVERLAAMGKMAAFTNNGKIPLAKPTDPLFVAALSIGNVPIDDPKDYATQRLHKTAGTKVDEVRKVSDVTIDDLSGIEIEASGHLVKSDEKIVLYQVMLFPPDQGYVLMTGLVSADKSETYLPKFRSLAKSWRATPVDSNE